jgi:hypothetical protein
VAIQAAPPQATTNEATTTEAITDPAAVSDSAILTPTPTFVVVTSTPTPVDVFEEATRVAQATEWAHILGPVTPTPPNLATPTPSSTPFIVALVNTPTPANAATATQVALLATAIAFTTGTPTPIPPEATVVIATETPLPPAPTSRPTPTPTPIYVLVENIPVVEAAPPPLVPEVLHNKIIFLTAFRGDPRRPNAMSINPDGTELALMTSNLFHALAASRDTLSADQRFHVFTIPEAGGEAHNAGRWQLFYDDRLYESYKHQLTYFGAGGAWDAVWSPTSETIAFVANETGNEEIWVTERGQYPARQLTQNEWEWDNNPSFSPDGSEIVFMSNRVTGSRQLWIMPAGGGEARQLTNLPYEAWDPVWVKYVEGQ